MPKHRGRANTSADAAVRGAATAHTHICESTYDDLHDSIDLASYAEVRIARRGALYVHVLRARVVEVHDMSGACVTFHPLPNGELRRLHKAAFLQRYKPR